MGVEEKTHKVKDHYCDRTLHLTIGTIERLNQIDQSKKSIKLGSTKKIKYMMINALRYDLTFLAIFQSQNPDNKNGNSISSMSSRLKNFVGFICI